MQRSVLHAVPRKRRKFWNILPVDMGAHLYHEDIDFVLFQYTNQYYIKFSRKFDVITDTFPLSVSQSRQFGTAAYLM
jgi:hypothetical protein